MNHRNRKQLQATTRVKKGKKKKRRAEEIQLGVLFLPNFGTYMAPKLELQSIIHVELYLI